MTTKAEREAEMLAAAEVQSLKSITGASDDQLVEIRPESVTAYANDANIGKVLELHYYLRYWNGVAACFIQCGLMAFNTRTETESVVWWPNIPAIFQQDLEPTTFETDLNTLLTSGLPAAVKKTVVREIYPAKEYARVSALIAISGGYKIADYAVFSINGSRPLTYGEILES